MRVCAGVWEVTYGDDRGEDEVVQFGGDGPNRCIVQVEREVWSEIGVDRGYPFRF